MKNTPLFFSTFDGQKVLINLLLVWENKNFDRKNNNYNLFRKRSNKVESVHENTRALFIVH